MKKKVIKLNESDLESIVKKILKEEGEERSSRYMFFSNLEQIHRQAAMLLEMDENMLEQILNNGHDWAQDHVAEAKNNMDQVFDFIMNKIKEPEDVHVDVVEEKWSKKYKKSIDCNNPKGFSQKAHCKGKLKEGLINEEGKNCADTEKGCIRKRKSGWVILNNKKGGVWRKCDSKKHCEEILDAFHASK